VDKRGVQHVEGRFEIEIRHHFFKEKTDWSLKARKSDQKLGAFLVLLFAEAKFLLEIVYVLSDCDVGEVTCDKL
jgi:hypothetical protein